MPLKKSCGTTIPGANLLGALQTLGTPPEYEETTGNGDFVAPATSRVAYETVVRHASPGEFHSHVWRKNDDFYYLGTDNNWYVIAKELLDSNSKSNDTNLPTDLQETDQLVELALQKGGLHDAGQSTQNGALLTISR